MLIQELTRQVSLNCRPISTQAEKSLRVAANALEAHRAFRYMMTGTLIGTVAAAAVFFPPAILAVAMLANSRIGEAYDLIIGVDGNRVKNTFELVQAIQDAKPGDIVYLAIVRKGRRLQIAVLTGR